MLLTVHDASLQKVAFIDNDKQGTLNYYDDVWTRILETGSSTFEFTVFKKSIASDLATKKTYSWLNEKAFVSFRYRGRTYLFNVMTVEEDEQTITCYCENLNLELINEYANPYKADRAMSFEEYCQVFGILQFAHLRIGLNEIADQKRQLEWEGQDTKLARLLSLAKKFEAEIDFETHLKADSSIKSFTLNVYHEHDDQHQGVGRVRHDIQLTYGKNLNSIKRTIDKTHIYTMVRPTGKRTVKNAQGEDVEELVTISGLSPLSEVNADGVREFFQSGDALYAPIAAQLYPSTFSSGTQVDQWIRKDLEVDSDNPAVIRAAGLRNLKKHAYPALTYVVKGFVDVEVGDTVRIYDDGFSPVLLVKARVSEQKISFTNPARNETTFANFKAFDSQVSGDIQAAFERLFEASKPYHIKLSTDNGVIFKNQVGETLITPSLYRGGKPVVAGVTWRWTLNGKVTNRMTYLVRGLDVPDTVTLTVAAYIDNDEVAVDEISLANVIDGKLGTPGAPGRDGRSSYIHTAWANDATGTDGFSLESSVNKLYIGVYTDFEPQDSRDPKRYKWTKAKGDKGDSGEKGDSGNGIVSVSNYYLVSHLASGITTDSKGWIETPQSPSGTNRYLWHYRIEHYSDGSSQTTLPAVIGVYGERGETGAQGPRGQQGAPGQRGEAGASQHLFTTAYRYPQSLVNSYGTAGYSGTWTVNEPTTSVRVGDIVQLSVYNTDKAGQAWIQAVVTAIPNQTSLTLTSKGLLEKGDKGDAGRFEGNLDFVNLVRHSKIKESSNDYGFAKRSVDLEAGKTYWLVARAKKTGGTPEKVTRVFLYNDAWSQFDWLEFNSTDYRVASKVFRPNVSGAYHLTSYWFPSGGDRSGTADVDWYMVVESDLAPKHWSPHPDDMQAQLDTKADAQLTQEQLNALAEKAQIQEAAIKAAATMDALSDLEKAYQSFTKAHQEGIKKSEKELIEAGRKLSILELEVGGLRELKTFVDTYMSSSNEGLVIGKNDASSTIKVSHDRISMFSAGKEVMYISQGVIHIDNGIFTVSVQVGKFRTEQYYLDEDMNVIRHIG